MLRDKLLFQSVFKHDMSCASEEIMAEVRRHTSEHVFHDAHSVLYTVHPMAEILLKVANVFRSENLALFTVTSIRCIRKSTKNRCNTKQKATENSRHKQVKRQRNRVDK